jgi:fatty acid desaturase
MRNYRYRIYWYNRLLLVITLLIFLTNWVCIFNYYQSNLNVLYFLVNLLSLHYMFTVVHQSSHYLLASNIWINHVWGFLSCVFAGITFADFQFTHDLHHKHIGFPSLDPDHTISGSGPVLLIPFKIFYHDIYFLKNNTSVYLYLSYISQRSLQVLIVCTFFLSQTWLFINFWLVPMLIIGVANALFLFYFPHYVHTFEKSIFNIPPIKYSINISRVYHHQHHDNPANNSNFFPLEDSIVRSLLDRPLVHTSKRDYFYQR